jgi:hypothetical protein
MMYVLKSKKEPVAALARRVELAARTDAGTFAVHDKKKAQGCQGAQ